MVIRCVFFTFLMSEGREAYSFGELKLSAGAHSFGELKLSAEHAPSI